MTTLQQKQIDQFFSSLEEEAFKDRETLDVWFVRARTCTALALGGGSPLLPLLDEYNKKSPGDGPAPGEEELKKRLNHAKQILRAAREQAAFSNGKEEEDPDLKKEAERAIHKAAIPYLGLALAVLLG